MKQKIEAYIDSKGQEFLAALGRLIAIPSERGEATVQAPYGVEPLRALEEGLAIARQWGFEGQNVDNIVGCVDILPENDDYLHILAHLDVVPAGEGWSKEPFALTVEGDNLFGRGVNDDKGPALAALLAMRCVKELGVPLRHNVRLILGTDEERGSSDIAHYYAGHPYGKFSFTPDAEFPVIVTEKGHYRPTLTASWQPATAGGRIVSIHGSDATNVVPARATAVVAGVDERQLASLCAAAEEVTGVSFSLAMQAGGYEIAAAGTGAHAASPEGGNNALTALLRLLAALPLEEADGGAKAVNALTKLFPHGDFYGEALGVAQEDDSSGKLTLAFTVCDLSEGRLTAQFDSRVPVCATEENCKAVCEAACAAAGFAVEGAQGAAHHVPADSPFVTSLLDALEQFTGTRGEPLAIGGGTYVHNIPGGVAFGCTFPGFEPRLHGADETMPLSHLLTSAKIFALAIADICGEGRA